MKIVHIVTSFKTGGIETMLVDILNEQGRSEIVSLIIINSSVNKVLIDKISPKVRIRHIQRPIGSRNPYYLIKLNKFLYQEKCDIIHCHGESIIKYIFPCFLKKNTRIVFTAHAMKIKSKSLLKYNRVFAISKSVKKDIEGRYGIKCRVVYNGIYTKMIKQRGRKKLANVIKIIQVSNLIHEDKGQDVLVEAINILVNHENIKNVQIYLVGEGASRLKLEQMIIDYNLSKNIILLGEKSRDWVYQNLRNYDIYVQASRNEGFGLSVTEAMAAKLPLITSNVDGPAEIINFGEYGFTFENENPKDLSEKIKKVIYLYNNGKIFEMIESAQSHCNINFNLKRTAINYLNYYN